VKGLLCEKRPGLKRVLKKAGRSERRRTSAAEAARQNGTYGTAEAVPLSKHDFSATSEAPRI
jgi:hypothetical protein